MDARELGGDSNNKELGVKKGAWSSQEDSLLINYIAINGEGRWNHVARLSGLRRTGKSCRLRWKNYLRPNVRRGNFTLEEQHRIMELHCFYGNRWSKIALFLPGRTDNEIKNYWRSRVVKQAKQLKYDINSVELREFIRDVCLPRLSEYIHASSQFNNNYNNNNNNNNNNIGNVMMNCDVTENIRPDALEVDQRATWSNIISSEAHEGPSSCGFYNPTSFDENLGQQYYGVDGYGFQFQGSGSPVWFSCGEISNLYATKGNT